MDHHSAARASAASISSSSAARYAAYDSHGNQEYPDEEEFGDEDKPLPTTVPHGHQPSGSGSPHTSDDGDSGSEDDGVRQGAMQPLRPPYQRHSSIIEAGEGDFPATADTRDPVVVWSAAAMAAAAASAHGGGDESPQQAADGTAVSGVWTSSPSSDSQTRPNWSGGSDRLVVSESHQIRRVRRSKIL